MKRFISIIVAFVLILAIAIPVMADDNTASAEKSFTDVKEGSWFYNSVSYCAKNGIMIGVTDSEFQPNTNMTRAMFVTVLYRISGENAPSTASSFTDVPEAAWYSDAVKWAKQNNIANGITKTEFAPNARVTREQMCTFIVRFSDHMGYALTAPEEKLGADRILFNELYSTILGVSKELSVFIDTYDISDYAVDNVYACYEQGIILGMSEGVFEPKGYATRAQACTMLVRFIRNMTTESEIASDGENGTVITIKDLYGTYATVNEKTTENEDGTTSVHTVYNTDDPSDMSYVSDEILNDTVTLSSKTVYADGSIEESSFDIEKKTHTLKNSDGSTVVTIYDIEEDEIGQSLIPVKSTTTDADGNVTVTTYDITDDEFSFTTTQFDDKSNELVKVKYSYGSPESDYLAKIDVTTSILSNTTISVTVSEPTTDKLVFAFDMVMLDTPVNGTITVDFTNESAPTVTAEAMGEKETIEFSEFVISILEMFSDM